MALIKEKLQKAHVDHVDPNLNCILVILPSKYFPRGILMERENIILEWIFLPHKYSKKFKKINAENFSELILKGKLRLYQLAGVDPCTMRSLGSQPLRAEITTQILY